MMRIITEQIHIETRGDDHIIDLTRRLANLLRDRDLQAGTATIFVSGSTAGVTTIEFEPGLVKDLPEAFERLAPRKHRYHHDDAWGDGNGHAHIRASLLGCSLTIPFADGRLCLGTWQQIVLVDFDNRPRSRNLIVQFTGE